MIIGVVDRALHKLRQLYERLMHVHLSRNTRGNFLLADGVYRLCDMGLHQPGLYVVGSV